MTSSEYEQADAAHCERIRNLNARFDIARTDDARNNIQQLIDSENLRWSLVTKPTKKITP